MEQMQNLSRRIQLVFWDFVIHTLSESDLVRGMIRASANIAYEIAVPQMFKSMGIVSIAGLASGSMLALLAYYLYHLR